jgi:hypothetical protein
MMIAAGVYNRRNIPRGPALEKIKYRISPKPTVGMPIIALKKLLMNSFPRKFLVPKANEIGIPQSKAMAVAALEIKRERVVISKTRGLPEKISCNALAIPSNISIRRYPPS